MLVVFFAESAGFTEREAAGGAGGLAADRVTSPGKSRGGR
jgi:hypothetical protein